MLQVDRDNSLRRLWFAKGTRGVSSLGFARDFGAWLGRDANASTSTPPGHSLRERLGSAQDDRFI
jgi:hypothetical protein